MDMLQFQRFLIWNAVINYAVLLVWFLTFSLAKGWIRSIHSRWFKLSPEQFDAIHYACIAIYKIAVLAIFLIPWIVIKFIL